MAWGSTHKTKLHKIRLKQKHVTHLICSENKFTHTKPLMRSLQVLSILQISIEKTLVFMHRVKILVMRQVFLLINLPIHPRDTQEILAKQLLLRKYLSHK